MKAFVAFFFLFALIHTVPTTLGDKSSSSSDQDGGYSKSEEMNFDFNGKMNYKKSESMEDNNGQGATNPTPPPVPTQPPTPPPVPTQPPTPPPVPTQPPTPPPVPTQPPTPPPVPTQPPTPPPVPTQPPTPPPVPTQPPSTSLAPIQPGMNGTTSVVINAMISLIIQLNLSIQISLIQAIPVNWQVELPMQIQILLSNIKPSDLEALKAILNSLNGNGTFAQFQLSLQMECPGIYALLQYILAASSQTPATTTACPAAPTPQPTPPQPTPAQPTPPQPTPAPSQSTQKPCPPEGEWSEWGNPTACSDTCGNCGTQQLSRNCLSSINNCPCSGPFTKTQNCNPTPCIYPKNSCCGSFVSKAVNGKVECA